jgi:hypothetical protein
MSLDWENNARPSPGPFPSSVSATDSERHEQFRDVVLAVIGSSYPLLSRRCIHNSRIARRASCPQPTTAIRTLGNRRSAYDSLSRGRRGQQLCSRTKCQPEGKLGGYAQRHRGILRSFASAGQSRPRTRVSPDRRSLKPRGRIDVPLPRCSTSAQFQRGPAPWLDRCGAIRIDPFPCGPAFATVEIC